MKRTLTKTCRLVVFPFFLLCALSILPGQQLHAQQTLHDDTFAVPQGNFVNVATAITRIDAQLSLLKTTMAPLDPHSPSYRELHTKYNYYQRMRDILAEAKDTTGAEVAKAIADALSIVVTDEGGYSVKQARALRDEAVNLLKA